jgi:hypothetical protein
MTTILQAPLLVDFLYPLLLVFFIVFAILQKLEIFGKDKSQLNAAIGLVVSLIFVGAVFPKLMVQNMVLYMSVALIVIFVALMFWGFISGKSDLTVTDDKGKKIRKIFAFLIFGSLIFAFFWASGVSSSLIDVFEKFFRLLFGSSWSGSFWTNFIFVLIVAVAVLVVLGINPFENWGKKPWIRLGK